MKKSADIKIFIIDDDLSMRKAISMLLRSEGFETEVFDSAEKFLAREKYFGIGCIVLDINMENMSGIELQDELLKKNIQLPIVFVTGHGDIPTTVNVMKKGAVDFLTKPFDDKDFLFAVTNAIEKCFGFAGNEKEKKKLFGELMELTQREMAILKFVIGGFMNKEISARLNIAEQTVKIHRGNLMRKLKVDSIADLVRKAEKANITPEVRN